MFIISTFLNIMIQEMANFGNSEDSSRPNGTLFGAYKVVSNLPEIVGMKFLLFLKNSRKRK